MRLIQIYGYFYANLSTGVVLLRYTLPGREAGCSESFRRRILVAGVDELLENDKALAEQSEERMVRNQAQ